MKAIAKLERELNLPSSRADKCNASINETKNTAA